MVILIIFSYFRRSEVLSSSATREATRIHVVYYSHIYLYDSLKNFCLLFLSLLTAQIGESRRVYARTYFIFSKNILKETWKSFNTKVQLQQKDGNSSYQGRETLAFSYKFFALILRRKFMKWLRVTKIVKQIKF